MDELLELDEASKLLTREDEAELKKEQERQKEQKESHGTFVEEFRERRVHTITVQLRLASHNSSTNFRYIAYPRSTK